MTLPGFPAAGPDGDAIRELRHEVRAFLDDALAGATPVERARSWMGFDAGFSRRLGERGWLGMTWPREYGGHGRSALERYVVLEEMLAAGAPVAAHWIADRQSGPTLLRYGTEAQKREFLPRIAAGTCFFCIGMSEPDSGSDLAATRTRAVAAGGDFVVNGAKLWTTYAHRAHMMILFCRTGAPGERHTGTSQFLIDLTTPGITINPIINLEGGHEFNEVVFEDVVLPGSALIGRLGDGWNQVTSELAFERSGPERFLSSFTLLDHFVRGLAPGLDGEAARAAGRLVAHLMALRQLSRSVAMMLQNGDDPALQACIVKDLGADLEQAIPEAVRLAGAILPDALDPGLAGVLARTMLAAPGFSLRGGTREILRGIVARGLGLG